MAEFAEVMKQRKRLCEANSICNDCPVNYRNNKHYISCTELGNCYPQEAEEIIMKWAEEHPIQTNADKFKEVMEKTFGVSAHLSSHCSLIDCPDDVACGDCEYKDFWKKEYKEPKGEE